MMRARTVGWVALAYAVLTGGSSLGLVRFVFGWERTRSFADLALGGLWILLLVGGARLILRGSGRWMVIVAAGIRALRGMVELVLLLIRAPRDGSDMAWYLVPLAADLSAAIVLLFLAVRLGVGRPVAAEESATAGAAAATEPPAPSRRPGLDLAYVCHGAAGVIAAVMAMVAALPGGWREGLGMLFGLTLLPVMFVSAAAGLVLSIRHRGHRPLAILGLLIIVTVALLVFSSWTGPNVPGVAAVLYFVGAPFLALWWFAFARRRGG